MLVAEGKLDRARRVLESASARCPIDVPHFEQQLAGVRAALSDTRLPQTIIEAGAATKDTRAARLLFDRALQRLDKREGTLAYEIVAPPPSDALPPQLFSPDSRFFTYARGSLITRMAIDDRSEITIDVGDSVSGLSFSADTRYLAVTRDHGTIAVYRNTASGLEKQWELKPAGDPIDATVGADGTVYVSHSGGYDDPVVIDVWQDSKLVRSHETEQRGGASDLRLTNGDRRLVASTGMAEVVWSTDTFKELSLVGGNFGGTSIFVGSRDGRRVASLEYGMSLVLVNGDSARRDVPVGGHCNNHATDVMFIDGDRTVAVRAGFGTFDYVDAASGRTRSARPPLPAGVDQSVSTLR